VNDADALAARRCSCQAGHAGKQGIKPDREHKREDGEREITRDSTDLAGFGNTRLDSGVSLDRGRSLDWSVYRLQRGMQVSRV
jgi:hypothetical protein